MRIHLGMGSVRWRLVVLYSPAIAALLWQSIVQPVWAQKLLTIALFLLSLDLLKMAIFDLEQADLVQSNLVQSKSISTQIPVLDTATDHRLAWFQKVTIGTIIVELLGLYSVWFSLALGTIVVLLSQIGFNLLAQVQLLPDQSEMIQSFGVRDRAVVLIADIVGIGLVAIGLSGRWQLETAIGLLAMVVTYGFVKFLSETRKDK